MSAPIRSAPSWVRGTLRLAEITLAAVVLVSFRLLPSYLVAPLFVPILPGILLVDAAIGVRGFSFGIPGAPLATIVAGFLLSALIYLPSFAARGSHLRIRQVAAAMWISATLVLLARGPVRIFGGGSPLWMFLAEVKGALGGSLGGDRVSLMPFLAAVAAASAALLVAARVGRSVPLPEPSRGRPYSRPDDR